RARAGPRNHTNLSTATAREAIVCRTLRRKIEWGWAEQIGRYSRREPISPERTRRQARRVPSAATAGERLLQGAIERPALHPGSCHRSVSCATAHGELPMPDSCSTLAHGPAIDAACSLCRAAMVGRYSGLVAEESGEAFEVVACSVCGLGRTRPQP